MSKRQSITIGERGDGTTFTLPLDIIVDATAVLGRRGTGKTNTAKRIVEGAVRARHQVIVLDPLDVWWGLKSGAVKGAAGLDVLLLGDPRKPHTDLPLREQDGHQLADLLVNEQLPCVVSMRHLSKSARRRFAADFLERFFHRKGDPGKNTPCLLAIDEASMFVPQTQREPEQARLIGAVESCVRQGRSSGIGVIVIDQRPASVNKDVLTQVELLIVHQLTGPQDRAAVKSWIDQNAAIDAAQVKAFMESLSSLQLPRASGAVRKGAEAWFWSPALLNVFERVEVAKADTFDSSRTPRPGETAVKAASVHKYDLAMIRSRWDAVIEQVERDDPAKLRGKLAALERELKAARAQPPQEAEPTVDVDAVVAAAIAKRDAQWIEQAKLVGERLRELVQPSGPVTFPVTIGPPPRKHPPTAAVKHAAAPRPSAPADHYARNGDLSRVAHKVLAAFAWWHALGVERVTRQHVAVKAGYTNCETSSYRVALYELRDAHLVTPAIDALTPAGHAAVPSPAAPGDMAAYHRMLGELLSGTEAKALDVLCSRLHSDGDVTTREDLATALGYTNVETSSYRVALYKLRTMGLVELPSGRGVVATALLFPEALK